MSCGSSLTFMKATCKRSMARPIDLSPQFRCASLCVFPASQRIGTMTARNITEATRSCAITSMDPKAVYRQCCKMFSPESRQWSVNASISSRASYTWSTPLNAECGVLSTTSAYMNSWKEAPPRVICSQIVIERITMPFRIICREVVFFVDLNE